MTSYPLSHVWEVVIAGHTLRCVLGTAAAWRSPTRLAGAAGTAAHLCMSKDKIGLGDTKVLRFSVPTLTSWQKKQGWREAGGRDPLKTAPVLCVTPRLQ